MALVRSGSSETRSPLQGWEMAEVSAGAAAGPADLARLSPAWLPAQVPGTVASSLRAAGRFVAATADRLDHSDWWYRCRIVRPAVPGALRSLRFPGLATLARVFLDGQELLASDNMFVGHEVELPASAPDESELLLCFASVGAALRGKWPRPRWKARMFESQNLRFVRTALLGRIAAWSASAPAIGPWRGVEQVERRGALVEEADVRATALPRGGLVEAQVRLRARVPTKATLRVGKSHAALTIEAEADGRVRLAGSVELPDAEHWWPHTHGAQPLYPVSLQLDEESFELGRTGFRTVDLQREGGKFEVSINGRPLFCRGACWTTADLLTLEGDPAPLLRDAVAAGMNMIRVIGFAAYETDRFYDLCDELGLLVWQDFMFGNLDYPAADAAFAESVRTEAAQQLSRLQLAPCLAILSGSSEVRQAATMNGLHPAQVLDGIFQELLPGLSRRWRPDVPYVEASTSSSPVGFRLDRGPSHYFGVGAYLRPLTDIRRVDLRFASECLAVSRVPDDRTIEAFLPPGAGPVVHPAWKASSPRDAGAGWDFDDVREHYMRELFRIDPVELRWGDPGRYLEAARVATGELLTQAIAEMRATGSSCAGALIWTLNDFVPSAGWGLIDALGRRKAAWYFVRRAFRSSLHLTDEGLNGLRLHALNERDHPLEAVVKLTLLLDGDAVIAAGEQALSIGAGRSARIDADQLLGGFLDSAQAYRFGPAGYHSAHAELIDRNTGAVLGDVAHFPRALPIGTSPEVALSGELRLEEPGRARLTLRSAKLATWVALDAGPWIPEDNFFHVRPSVPTTVVLAGPSGGKAPEVVATPFNARVPTRIAVKSL